MSVDASIRPQDGGTLGSASEVRDAFSQFFPAISFTRGSHSLARLRSLVADQLPPEMSSQLRDATHTPFSYRGHLQEEGWSMLLDFDDSLAVSEITISFYGSHFDRAQTRFEALLAAKTWEIKWL